MVQDYRDFCACGALQGPRCPSQLWSPGLGLRGFLRLTFPRALLGHGLQVPPGLLGATRREGTALPKAPSRHQDTPRLTSPRRWHADEEVSWPGACTLLSLQKTSLGPQFLKLLDPPRRETARRAGPLPAPVKPGGHRAGWVGPPLHFSAAPGLWGGGHHSAPGGVEPLEPRAARHSLRHAPRPQQRPLCTAQVTCADLSVPTQACCDTRSSPVCEHVPKLPSAGRAPLPHAQGGPRTLPVHASPLL